MEYTVRFAFKRGGEIMAPPRVTYSSHDAPAEVRDVYRDAVTAALARCTPLYFSKGMGGAVAGRPIAIRFVDDRDRKIAAITATVSIWGGARRREIRDVSAFTLSARRGFECFGGRAPNYEFEGREFESLRARH